MEIHNSDIAKRIREIIKSQDQVDQVPRELGKTIVPVLITNPKSTVKTFRVSLTKAQLENGIYVPAGKKWKIKCLSFQWASDITGGNRDIVFESWDSVTNNLLFRYSPAAFQIASLNYSYAFVGDFSGEMISASTQTNKILPIPDFFLRESDVIYLYDENSVAGGDTLTSGCMVYEERELLNEEFEIKNAP